MNEMHLIDLLSYLDPELLDNDYIENDIREYNSAFKTITFIFAGAAVVAGVVGIIVKHKKVSSIGKSLPKIPKKVVKLVTN